MPNFNCLIVFIWFYRHLETHSRDIDLLFLSGNSSMPLEEIKKDTQTLGKGKGHSLMFKISGPIYWICCKTATGC